MKVFEIVEPEIMGDAVYSAASPSYFFHEENCQKELEELEKRADICFIIRSVEYKNGMKMQDSL